MANQNFVEIDGAKYQVKPKSLQRGTMRSPIQRLPLGDKDFSQGIFPTKGQNRWSDGFQKKFAKSDGEGGFFKSLKANMEYGDRVLLAKSWSGTVYDTTENEVRFATAPWRGKLYAYSPDAEEVYVKDGSNAWAAVDLSGIAWTTTDPTGFLSDTIGPIAGTNYLLIGSDKGHVLRIAADGSVAEQGRPSTGSLNLFGGIYAMTYYQSALILGGADSNSNGVIGTYNGTTLTQTVGAATLGVASRVQTLTNRYVPGDRDPHQLHIGLVRTDQDYAAHQMFDGASLQTLREFLDDRILCALKYDVSGSTGLLFGMKNKGVIWRYTGDYSEILHLDTPDSAYTLGITSIVQYGRFIVTAMKDATNGVTLLWYDGKGWWQGGTPGSTYSGEASGLGVYKNTLFLGHAASGAAKILEMQTGSNFESTGYVETAQYDCDYREVPKEWLKARAEHAPLGSGESVKIEYVLDDAAGEGAFTETFDGTAYKDATNTTAVWDTGNGYVTVPGNAVANFVGINNGSTTHTAHKYQAPTPTDLAPASIVTSGSEASSANYDGIEADDASTWASGSTTGTEDQTATTTGLIHNLPNTAHRLGQTFQPGASDTLSAVIGKLHVTTGQSATVEARLYATSGGLPTGAALATSDSVSVTETSATDKTFSFASPYSVTSGTTYAIVFVATAQTAGLRLTGASSSSYANGQAVLTSDGGASWAAAGSPADLYFKTYRGGTFGKAIQLARFKVTEVTLHTILPRAIATSSGGFTLYIWNAVSLAWESVATTSASTEQTLTGTISSNVANYRDANNYISLMLVSSATGTNATAATLTTDFIRLDASYTTDAKTARSTTFDTAQANITAATITLTTNSSGTYTPYVSRDGGTTWTAVTSGVSYAFGGGEAAGSLLRWRVDITAASATAQPQLQEVAVLYAAGALVTLGTNSQQGSMETEFAFGNPVVSKTIRFRVTLGGGGTTTPQLYSIAVDYLLSPDVKRTWSMTLKLQHGVDYTDGTTETRTAAQQYTALETLRRTRVRPSFKYIDGTEVTEVTLEAGFFQGDDLGVPVDDDNDARILLPIKFIEVRA